MTKKELKIGIKIIKTKKESAIKQQKWAKAGILRDIELELMIDMESIILKEYINKL